MWSTDDMDTLKKNALKICQEYLAGPWLNITCGEFTFSVISGGLSNRLYLCSLPDNCRIKDAEDGRYPKKALLRIYGPMQDNLSMILREVVIFTQLSEKKVCPKLYGIFPEGRLEEYIPSQNLIGLDIRKYSTAIAREMAKAHCQCVPISKNPKMLIETVQGWLSFLEENADNCKLTENHRQLIKSKQLSKEMEWMIDLLEKENSPVVFCHNDIQWGNILLREDKFEENGEKSILLIDYEFSAYNYRGYDFGYHFSSWCFKHNAKSFPFYEIQMDKFPSEEEQLAFIEVYLNQMEELGGSFSCGSIQEEKMKILEEIKTFVLLPNLLGTIWGLKMGGSPPTHTTTDFEYEEYGEMTWRIYQERKAEFLKNTNSTTTNGN